MSLILVNTRTLLPDGTVAAVALRLEGETIAELGTRPASDLTPDGVDVLDGGGLLLAPASSICTAMPSSAS